jgi:hypothetical protein
MYRRKLFRSLFPALQFRVFLLVLFSAGASVLVHVALTALSLSRLATNLPTDGPVVFERIPAMLSSDVFLTLLISIPAFGILGLVATMPMFGAIHHFRMFLGAVVRGEQTEPCRLRKSDPFQDICELMNRATELARAKSQGAKHPQAGEPVEAVGAPLPSTSDSKPRMARTS